MPNSLIKSLTRRRALGEQGQCLVRANVLTKRAAPLGGKLSSMMDAIAHQYMLPPYFLV